jgi:cell division protein FtsN
LKKGVFADNSVTNGTFVRTFSEHFVNLIVDLSKHIEILLRDHNCVIVPDFGGFIANYRSAVIDRDHQRIIPPSKSVLFNGKLTSNDGLLANAIAIASKMTYPDALKHIANHVAEWKTLLKNGQRVEVGEVGFLYREQDQIVFEQSRELNLLLQAYGLSGVKFVGFEEGEVKQEPAKTTDDRLAETQTPKTIKTETVDSDKKETVVLAGESEKIVETKETPVVPITPSTEKKGRWKYLAAVAAIPLLFYSYWIPVKTDFLDTGKIQMADFNPIKHNPVRHYQKRLESSFIPYKEQKSITWEQLTSDIAEHVEVYNYALDDDFYIPVRLDREADIVEEEMEVNAAPVINAELPYHVIGGCFSIENNANQLVADLKKQGYAAHVLDKKNGLYRVSSGDYASRSEASNALKGFKNAGFSGWVLKK